MTAYVVARIGADKRRYTTTHATREAAGQAAARARRAGRYALVQRTRGSA